MSLPLARRLFVVIVILLAGSAARSQTNPEPVRRTSNNESFQLQTLPPPDFAGSVNPTYQSVVTGNAANYAITITAINGFAGEILFSATGFPEGATATFTPNTVIGSGSTTLKISTTAATLTGTYHIMLAATSGSLVHSGGVTLSVGPAGTNFADFTGSAQPSYQTIQPGGMTSFDLEIDPLYGFASDVSMSASGLPAGGTAAFSPSIVAGGSGPTVLTVSVPSSTPTGTYLLTITATGGGRSHNNTVAVNVGPPGTDFTDFTGSITPQTRTVTVGGSTTFSVNIQPLYGTGCVTLQSLEVPPATGAAYDRTTPICGGPATTVLTITTTPQTPLGTYTITILGLSSGGNTHSKNVTLTVTPP